MRNMKATVQHGDKVEPEATSFNDIGALSDLSKPFYLLFDKSKVMYK